MATVVAYEPPDSFDFEGFYAILKSKLPTYAMPTFVRFKQEFEYTETMKLKKAKLKKEGFDLNQVTEPLFVRLPGGKDYTLLTREIFESIVKGDCRF